MINNSMLSLLSLSQLEHKARIEDNELALVILDKMEEEIEDAVEQATTKNDADYHYEIWDAVNTIKFLIEAIWYKVEETKFTKDKIIYMVQGLHEDTSPHNNQVKLWKYKGSDNWKLEVNAGQYGEQIDEAKFTAAGFKEAQQLATKRIVRMIRDGLQLNI